MYIFITGSSAKRTAQTKLSPLSAWYAGGAEGTNCVFELRIRLWNEGENEDRSSDTVRLGAAARDYDIEIYSDINRKKIRNK